MTMPNFLIIGAEKSGTSSLYYYLKQHPQVYMSPVKEPNFFAFEGEKLDRRRRYYRQSITGVECYRMLFRGASDKVAIGEASPLYLSNPKAPKRIQYYIPNAKLIAILRNPVERAYSDFLQAVRNENEPLLDFSLLNKNQYVQKGLYYVHISRYLECFDKKQIRIYLYEDLKNDPVYTVQDIFLFLGIEKTFVPDVSIKHNKGGIPKYKFLHNFLGKLTLMKSILRSVFPEEFLQYLYNTIRNRNLLDPPPLPRDMRRQFIETYRGDIVKLEKLIQRDLSGWLDV